MIICFVHRTSGSLEESLCIFLVVSTMLFKKKWQLKRKSFLKKLVSLKSCKQHKKLPALASNSDGKKMLNEEKNGVKSNHENMKKKTRMKRTFFIADNCLGYYRPWGIF